METKFQLQDAKERMGSWTKRLALMRDIKNGVIKTTIYNLKEATAEHQFFQLIVEDIQKEIQKLQAQQKAGVA